MIFIYFQCLPYIYPFTALTKLCQPWAVVSLTTIWSLEIFPNMSTTSLQDSYAINMMVLVTLERVDRQ